MSEHNLKTWPAFFDAVRDGRKTFEVRKNDRGFQTGDVLVLQKWTQNNGHDPAEPLTGPRGWFEDDDPIRARVTYLLSGFGIEPGYVVMGIAVEDAGNGG